MKDVASGTSKEGRQERGDTHTKMDGTPLCPLSLHNRITQRSKNQMKTFFLICFRLFILTFTKVLKRSRCGCVVGG